MSDAIPIPARPSLEQYKKQAKDLLKACQSDDPAAMHAWATRWVKSWAELRRMQFAGQVDQIEKRVRSEKIAQLSDAQFFLARAHDFESWPKFTRHVEALKRAASPDAKFEAAADAIVSGDIDTLARLLKENPQLIHQRSSRKHRSTLLHYVSANGIEDFRQKTPKNAVEITKLLLDAGADVNDESDAYRGRSTTLGLVATSVHPQRACVQVPLMELLLDRGAIIEHEPGMAVRDCLANGRREAAEFLAARGAHLNLEGAAGVGRLDIVKTLFSSASKKQIEAGFLWACQFGRNDVIGFLLDNGVDPGVGAGSEMTGLHWAAHEGHLDTVKLLLARGAPLEAKNVYGGTVLGAAIWSAINHPRPDHLKIIEKLVDAGAKVGEDWFTGYPQIDAVLRRA